MEVQLSLCQDGSAPSSPVRRCPNSKLGSVHGTRRCWRSIVASVPAMSEQPSNVMFLNMLGPFPSTVSRNRHYHPRSWREYVTTD
ncbi:hypothetical protein AAHA92_31155 [Salvia divinorum]|uniref:Uncharacterized protein n=1 Tax=Salvia divinorum TaxID=28513 RepID=A0ABD1FU66_SALDI